MAAAFVQLVQWNSNKTAGTSLVLNQVSGPAPSVTVGNDIFATFAHDDGGTGYGITHAGTAAITWTLEDSNLNAGNVAVKLYRGAVTGSGTVTSITLSWTTNVTAKAGWAAEYSGVGTRSTTGAGGTGTGTTATGITSKTVPKNGLAVVCVGFEDTNLETYAAGAASGTPSLTVLTASAGGYSGTSGGGDAGNITVGQLYAIGSAASDSTGFNGTGTDNTSADWAGCGACYNPSGNAYTQTVGGTLTSAGAILKQGNKTTAGTLTSASALLKQVARAITGTLTTAATALKRTTKTFTGTTTPTATLTGIRLVLVTLTGTVTSAAALLKQTQRAVTGTLTTTAATLKQTQRALTGTATSAGVLVKQGQKVLAGTLTSTATLLKQTRRSLTGAMASAGSVLKQVQRSVTGTVTTAAALVKQTRRAVTGTVATSGAVVKQDQRVLTGTLTTAGALLKATARGLAGSLGTSGTLAKYTQRALTATLGSAAGLLKMMKPFLTGSLAAAGVLVKQTGKAPAGTVAPSGDVDAAKQAGGINGIDLEATVTSSGAVTRMTNAVRTAAVSTAASLSNTRIGKALGGTLGLVGTLVKQTRRILTAALSMIGTLVAAIAAIGDRITTAAAVFRRTVTASTQFQRTVTVVGGFRRTITAAGQFGRTVTAQITKFRRSITSKDAER